MQYMVQHAGHAGYVRRNRFKSRLRAALRAACLIQFRPQHQNELIGLQMLTLAIYPHKGVLDHALCGRLVTCYRIDIAVCRLCELVKEFRQRFPGQRFTPKLGHLWNLPLFPISWPPCSGDTKALISLS